MCWADKLAIFLFSVLFLALMVMSDHPSGLGNPEAWRELAIVFLVIWIPLRLLRWVFR